MAWCWCDVGVSGCHLQLTTLQSCIIVAAQRLQYVSTCASSVRVVLLCWGVVPDMHCFIAPHVVCQSCICWHPDRAAVPHCTTLMHASLLRTPVPRGAPGYFSRVFPLLYTLWGLGLKAGMAVAWVQVTNNKGSLPYSGALHRARTTAWHGPHLLCLLW